MPLVKRKISLDQTNLVTVVSLVLVRNKFHSGPPSQACVKLEEELKRTFTEKFVRVLHSQSIAEYFLGAVTLPRLSRKACYLARKAGRTFRTDKVFSVVDSATVLQMFELSESFQTGIGLKPLPASFWVKSMFERPPNRKVACHSTAWDMYIDNDVRIKMCTDVNMDDLITIHHEMGHIQYYLQYESQITPFREGANSGFHEAVGDTLALSVSTPKHLTWLGLLKNNVEDLQSDLNYMFTTALNKIVFLPFAYIMDRYRYDVFSGKFPLDKLNEGWWSYVLEYQGLIPPVPRTERDFDPGSKAHVSNDVEYMRYFISFVIQFQFHKALCDAAGHDGPLYQCDINESKEAGRKLSDMLALGSSEPWPIALEKITGTRKMDASALLEFFEPLTRHLADLNALNNEFVGWKL